VLIGDGLGSFVSSSNYNPLNDPLSILTTDFNNDGNMDLATVNRGMGMAAGITGDVSVYLGDGSGGFLLNNTHGIGDSIVPPSFNTSNPLIVYGDFNNDQKNDLALTAFKSGVNYSSNIIIMLGDGLGGFAMPINIPIPNIPHAIIADDLNGDSKMDLAVLTKDVLTTCDLSILLNCNTTSLSDLDKLRIQLFPNPTNGRFEIVGTNDGDEISVVDILGKEVLKFNQQNQKRDFFIDRKGVYFVTIKSNKSNNVFKLVVND
jgi:hypothetical protein